jgi:hypothetical protein
MDCAQVANLIEGICQQFALWLLKREVPESPRARNKVIVLRGEAEREK